MYRRILVPLDGSPEAEQALPLAAGLASRSDEPLHLALVHRPPPDTASVGLPLPGGIGDAEILAAERRYLESLARRVRSSVPAGVKTNVLEGEVVRTLLDHASTSDTELIVIASHGRTGLDRAWLGSVTEEIVRSSAIPVLVARVGEKSSDIAIHVPVARVLVALDGSRFAEHALDHALDLLPRFRVEPEDVGALHRSNPLWFSMYAFTTESGAPPWSRRSRISSRASESGSGATRIRDGDDGTTGPSSDAPPF